MSHNTYNKQLSEQIFKVFQRQSRIIIDKLVKSVIRSMQSVKETPTSSDDLGLENLWDEYCLQCQSVENVMFESYEDAISGYIEIEINDLNSKNKADYESMLLYYSAFEDENIFEEEDCYSEPADHEIIRHIISEVRHEAGNYSNARISKALDI